MAFSHKEKERFARAVRELEAGHAQDRDVSDMLAAVRPLFEYTEAEVFAYATVLPLLTQEPVDVMDVVSKAGLPAQSKRSVLSALSRLVRDGEAASVKEGRGPVRYRLAE